MGGGDAGAEAPESPFSYQSTIARPLKGISCNCRNSSGRSAAIHGGERYLPPALAARLAERGPGATLTEREHEVLELVSMGLATPKLGTRRGRAEALESWGMNYSCLRGLVRHLVPVICLGVLSGVQPALSAAAATRKAAAKTAADADPFGVAVAPGKEYVYKLSGGVPQKLEVYFPPNWSASGPTVPGVIFFHGGSWSGGDLTQFRYACRYLASRGLVAGTANYRLSTKAERDKLPAGESNKRMCVTDAKSAIRWFKQHAADLGIDPQRIITGGGSAGGHVSVLATLNPGLNDPADPKDFDTRVAAYLLFNPAFRAADSADPAVDVLQHLGAGMAPAVFFFGTEDRTWKPGSDALLEKLQARGGSTAELWLGAGQAHGFFNRPPWQDVTLAEADRFLVRLGFLQGTGTLVPPGSGEKLERAPR